MKLLRTALTCAALTTSQLLMGCGNATDSA